MNSIIVILAICLAAALGDYDCPKECDETDRRCIRMKGTIDTLYLTKDGEFNAEYFSKFTEDVQTLSKMFEKCVEDENNPCGEAKKWYCMLQVRQAVLNANYKN